MPVPPPAPEHRLRALAALWVGVLCIGWSAIFVKLAGVPGVASAFYRLLIPALVLVPWRLAWDGPRPTRRLALIAMAGGIIHAANLVLWNSSLMLTSAAVATLLAYNAPLWVGLGALILFRERLTRGYWLGLGFAMAGIAVLMDLGALSHLRFNAGELLATAGGVLYAGYLLITQRVRSQMDTLTFMALSVASGALVLWAANLALGIPLTGYPLRAWAALAGLGLVSHLAGWLAINYALGHLKAASVSVSLLGQVIVTTLLAIPILGEIPAVHQVLGGLLVLAGIYVVNRGQAGAGRCPGLRPPARRREVAEEELN